MWVDSGSVLGRNGSIWFDPGRSGRIWVDLGRYGSVLVRFCIDSVDAANDCVSILSPVLLFQDLGDTWGGFSIVCITSFNSINSIGSSNSTNSTNSTISEFYCIPLEFHPLILWIV